MRAADIISLLANKHSDDVFVSECKDGPTHTNDHLRLDAWTMKKSWSNPCVTGYEVKISRSDFMRDEKWRGYLPLCNQFFFVCPAGLIKPEEIPAPAGLMTVSSTGTMLLKKKKAEWRDVEIPDSIYRYILFSRAKITRHEVMNRDRLFWERWLVDEKMDREFGWKVRGRIKAVVKEKIEAVEKENKELRGKHRAYDEVIAFLESIGISKDRYLSSFNVRNRIQEIQRVVPEDLETALHSLTITLAGFGDQLKKLAKPDQVAA